MDILNQMHLICLQNRSGTTYCFGNYRQDVIRSTNPNLGQVACKDLCYHKIMRLMSLLSAAKYDKADLFLDTYFDNMCTLKETTNCFDVTVRIPYTQTCKQNISCAIVPLRHMIACTCTCTCSHYIRKVAMDTTKTSFQTAELPLWDHLVLQSLPTPKRAVQRARHHGPS
jgi:hypothetical protein